MTKRLEPTTIRSKLSRRQNYFVKQACLLCFFRTEINLDSDLCIIMSCLHNNSNSNITDNNNNQGTLQRVKSISSGK